MDAVSLQLNLKFKEKGKKWPLTKVDPLLNMNFGIYSQILQIIYTEILTKHQNKLIILHAFSNHNI